MCRYFYLFLLTIFAGQLSGFEIALSVKLEPTKAFELLEKISTNFSNPFGDAKSASLFLVESDQGPLTPVILVQTTTPSAFIARVYGSPMWGKYSYHQSGEWVVGTSAGQTISFAELSELQKAIPQGNSPICGELYPKVILKVLNRDQKLTDQFGMEQYHLLADELSSLKQVRWQLSQVNDQTLRAIIFVQAQDKSDLGELFSQRLPQAFPPLYQRIETAQAPAYGYILFNPLAVGQYLAKLKAKGSDITSINELAAIQLGNAQGQAALWLDHSGNFYQVNTGNWSVRQAEVLLRLLREQCARWHPEAPCELSYAFNLKESPVWETKLGAKTLSYSALYKGSLFSAPSRKAIYSLFEQLDGQTPIKVPLTRNFSYYPRVNAQLLIRPRALLEALNQNQTLQIPDLFLALFDDTPIYVASSISDNSLAITADLPWNLIKVVNQLVVLTQP